jgi:hypothetical protein
MDAARARSALALTLACGALALWRAQPAPPPPPSRPAVLPDGAVGLLHGRRLDPNRASALDLEVVPGIGEARARGILEGRPYCALEDLERVAGIGPVTLRRAAGWLEVRTRPDVCPAEPSG